MMKKYCLLWANGQWWVNHTSFSGTRSAAPKRWPEVLGFDGGGGWFPPFGVAPPRHQTRELPGQEAALLLGRGISQPPPSTSHSSRPGFACFFCFAWLVVANCCCCCCLPVVTLLSVFCSQIATEWGQGQLLQEWKKAVNRMSEIQSCWGPISALILMVTILADLKNSYWLLFTVFWRGGYCIPIRPK